MEVNPTKWQYTKPRESVMEWLLDSDPSIRYQVMRDLMKESDENVSAECARTATSGWGAQVLQQQGAKGNWGGEADERNWLITVYTLMVLKDIGLDPSSEETRKAIRLVREIVWWQFDGNKFFDGETEPCINGAILTAGAYFGEGSELLVNRLLSEQLADGGWNCDAPKKSLRTSFHSTICVLEGLLEYEKLMGPVPAVTEARERAHAYMLNRGMLRSLSSGEILDREWLDFSFPPTWHYDLLRGLDYLRSAGVKPDERLEEAVQFVAAKQNEHGRWPLENPHPDRVSFDMETEVGEDSRWNTLRALRVLDWYYGQS
ncbi:hypothetical protein NV379_08545 [Paenibacillus sp. N1-5-1-14]|uniref:hypothetical protein n=1 Tax=Paenibacillus radicibacter TaxID=2972488 RepID=UPI002158CDAF|nr:hypothetical protein [Paenibacillus radicibacter]MCR8642710.1 hypothetical protein [Paenibacillus radicibacter]